MSALKQANASVSIYKNEDAGDCGPAAVISCLQSISKSVRALLYLKLAEIDFHNGQDEFLLALSDNECQGIGAVATHLNVRTSTVSKMCERLFFKGLVSRFVDKLDSRRTIICLTPEGVSACEDIRLIRQSLEAELFGKMSFEDRSNVARSLELVNSALRSRLSRLR